MRLCEGLHGQKIATVSANQPGSFPKHYLQNLATDRTPHSVLNCPPPSPPKERPTSSSSFLCTVNLFQHRFLFAPLARTQKAPDGRGDDDGGGGGGQQPLYRLRRCKKQRKFGVRRAGSFYLGQTLHFPQKVEMQYFTLNELQL